jgi:hypothetical protein
VSGRVEHGDKLCFGIDESLAVTIVDRFSHGPDGALGGGEPTTIAAELEVQSGANIEQAVAIVQGVYNLMADLVESATSPASDSDLGVLNAQLTQLMQCISHFKTQTAVTTALMNQYATIRILQVDVCSTRRQKECCDFVSMPNSIVQGPIAFSQPLPLSSEEIL